MKDHIHTLLETDHAKPKPELSKSLNIPMLLLEALVIYKTPSPNNQPQSPLMLNPGNSIQVESSPTVELH
jgi:hypothetical protein